MGEDKRPSTSLLNRRGPKKPKHGNAGETGTVKVTSIFSDTPLLIPTSTIAADQNPPLEDNSEERLSFYQLLESIDDKFTMKAMVKYPLERSMEKIMHLVIN